MIRYPTKVIARGSFSMSDIVIERVNLPPLPVDLEARVDRVWAEELARNPKATPGELLVAAGLEQADGKLLLRCGLSDYRRFMGTTSPEGVPEEYRHRAIGMLAVTTTADGYVMLGVRSPAIDWPLLRHVVPAGRLQPSELDPYTGVRAEFREELGLTPNDVVGLTCIGVVADQTLGRLNFEFVFRARTSLTAREVLERANVAKSVSEHCQLEPFPWQVDLIRNLLLVDPDGYVPTGWAGLAIALQDEFGNESFPDWTPVHRTYADHVGRRLKMHRVAVTSDPAAHAPQRRELGPLFQGLMANWTHQDRLLWERANTMIAVQAGLFAGAYALRNYPKVMACVFFAGAVLSLALFLIMLRHVAHRDSNSLVMCKTFVALTNDSAIAGETLIQGTPATWRAPVKASYILRSVALFFIVFDFYLIGIVLGWWATPSFLGLPFGWPLHR